MIRRSQIHFFKRMHHFSCKSIFEGWLTSVDKIHLVHIIRCHLKLSFIEKTTLVIESTKIIFQWSSTEKKENVIDTMGPIWLRVLMNKCKGLHITNNKHHIIILQFNVNITRNSDIQNLHHLASTPLIIRTGIFCTPWNVTNLNLHFENLHCLNTSKVLYACVKGFL